MTVKDAWETSKGFQWVMSIIASCLVLGMGALVLMYAEVRTSTALLRQMQADMRLVAERVLYLERQGQLGPHNID